MLKHQCYSPKIGEKNIQADLHSSKDCSGNGIGKRHRNTNRSDNINKIALTILINVRALNAAESSGHTPSTDGVPPLHIS